MDKSWINKSKWSPEYRKGVNDFLEFACKSQNGPEKILCPCKSCINRYFHTVSDVKGHLLSKGFFVGYVIWNRHGEEHINASESSTHESPPILAEFEQLPVADEQHNMENMEELLRDTFNLNNASMRVEDDCEKQNIHPSSDDVKFSKLLEDAGAELYPGCKSFSKLSFILQLFRLKCLHSWTTRSFDMLLELLIEAFPEGLSLPKNTYEVKKLMKTFDLGYVKIDACPNDCMLFWKEKSDEEVCNVCGSSRWVINQKSKVVVGKKSQKKPAKIIRYFPLTPRLQRLFKSRKTADNMIWHSKSRNKDGLLRHPADGEAWKSFDRKYPDFASDPRNIRLGLATDGFNPYKIMSTTYSIWPVILVPYNLPPWIGMKQTSFILSTIIPGAKSPGNNIDVYLQPLIQELCDLWQGVQCYDVVTGQNFNMRATLMWTINDFPAYGMLSGWSTKGRFACPCCVDKTESLWLYKSKKFAFMGHRRWLPDGHIYRKQKSNFDNTEEIRKAPSRLSGSEVLLQVNMVQNNFGARKKTKQRNLKRRRSSDCVENSDDLIIWKKKNILFDLPYWEHNLLPHNLDVMHIEKNVCDNFISTLLDLDKSKDNLKARQDLVDLGVKSQL